MKLFGLSHTQRVVTPVPSRLRDAFGAHAPGVRRLLLRLGVQESDVDDLLQDVFVIALRREADFQRRSSERTWLCGIAVRLATAHRRKRRLRSFFHLDDDQPATFDEADPARQLEQSELRREVKEVLDGLAPAKRAVLVLYEIEGLRGEEIAAALHCPLKTVWTRLFYARRDFAEALRKRGLGDETLPTMQEMAS